MVALEYGGNMYKKRKNILCKIIFHLIKTIMDSADCKWQKRLVEICQQN